MFRPRRLSAASRSCPVLEDSADPAAGRALAPALAAAGSLSGSHLSSAELGVGAGEIFMEL
jgi:hypothetical protein